jgi:tripartite-type tricarboxylate transporter receptor subunit TctC
MSRTRHAEAGTRGGARRREWLARMAVALLAPGAALPALAQSDAASFPDRPIRIVLSVPPGGGMDALARVIADGLSKRTGKPAIVENRPGGTGAIAIQQVLKQPADGHTLYFAPDAAFMFVPVVRKMPYQPIDDFTFISRLAYTPNVIAVANSVPARDLKEFVALAKSSPGKLNYGTMLGVPAQMDFERLKRAMDIDVASIPYLGGAPIATAMLEGSVQSTLFPMSSFSQHIRAGKLRALAVTSSKRFPTLPDVPTLAEAGLPNLKLDEGQFFALAGPAGVPRPVVDKLHAMVTSILSEPDLRRKLLEWDMEVSLADGETFKKTVVRQLADNESTVKALNIKIE